MGSKALTVVVLAYLFVGMHEVLSGQQVVTINGSSTVYPITRVIGLNFEKEFPGITVIVRADGTAGGFSDFLAGKSVIHMASRPLTNSETEQLKAEFVQYKIVSVGNDGITIAVSPHLTFLTSLTFDQLQSIYKQGSTVKTWKDINPEWPEVRLLRAGMSSKHGTHDFFKDQVTKEIPMAPFTAFDKDEELVHFITENPGAVGFMSFSTYAAHFRRINAIAIDFGNGPVRPSYQTISGGLYQSLSRPLLLLVRKEAPEPVVTFLDYFLRNAAPTCKQLGLIPLSNNSYTQERSNLGAIPQRFR